MRINFIGQTPFWAALILCVAIARAGAEDLSIKRLAPPSTGTQYLLIRNAALQSAAIRNAIFANYRFYEDCLRNANSEDVIALEATDFQSRDASGQIISKISGDNNLRLLMDRVTKINAARIRVNRITLEHGTAVALVTTYFDVMTSGDDNLSHRLIASSRSRDTWVQRDGEWKIGRSEGLRSYTTLDGKTLVK
jgi:hypothetical protein